MPHELPDFERRLNDLLDDRQRSEDDAWPQSQAALSEDHRKLLTGQQLMLDGVELLDTPELPADFAQRCVALAMGDDVHPTPSQDDRTRNGRWSVVTWVSVCAVLLAFVAAVPLWNLMQGSPEVSSNGSTPSEFGSSIELPEGESPPDEVPDSDLVDVPSETSPSDSETNSQYEELNESNLLAQRDYNDLIRQAFEEWRERDEELFSPRPQWMDDVALGFRPVADSVGGAINVLRRNLPPSPRIEGEEKPQAGLQPADAASSVS